MADNDWIALPTSIALGSIKTICLNSGIRLVILDYGLNQPTIMEYVPSVPSCGFGFCLSGDIEARMAGWKKPFSIQSGQSAFYSVPDMAGLKEKVAPERVVRVSVMMDPKLLRAFAGEKADRLPSALQDLSKRPCRFAGTITPGMRVALYQILECPYHGLTRDLYIEGKVLELVAYKMEQLESESNRPSKRSVVKSGDVDRVRHAAQRLAGNLENPPCLNELARSVGMSRSKLHHCFRTVYGITPFDYLRNRRLETAGRLLREGKLNVTETAYSVGYASLSHFTKAFKQHFGFPPGKCQKYNDFRAR